MHSFHFAPDRERYAVAHANLRRILGGYLHQPAKKISFHANRFGKPELAGEASSLHFSLSHSQSIAVLAVAHGLPLGVDVEEVRPIEPEVAATHFSASELSHLNRIAGRCLAQRLLSLLDAQGSNPQGRRSGPSSCAR